VCDILTAFNKRLQKKYNVIEGFDFDPHEDSWRCNLCEGKMIYVSKSINGRTDHFRHYASQNCSYEPESEIHLEMKRHIYEEFPKYNKIKSKDLERNINNKAVLDVYFELENDIRIGFECQVSNINWNTFKKRMEIYKENNIYVIWLFHYDSFLHKETVNFDEKINPELLYNLYGLNANIVRPNSFINEISVIYFDAVYFYRDQNIFSISFSPLEVLRDSSEDLFNDYVNNENYIQYYETKKLAFERIFPSLKVGQIKENLDFNIALFQEPTKNENNYIYLDNKEEIKKVIDNTSKGYYDKELHHYFTGLNKYELKENFRKFIHFK
jgi:hypothetical protein